MLVKEKYDLSIWIENIEQCYSLKPLINIFKKNNIKVQVFFPDTNLHILISNYFNIPKRDIISVYEKYYYKSRVLGFFTNLYIGSFASKNYSQMYERIISDLPMKYKLLRFLMPKMYLSLSKYFILISKIFLKDIFISKKILVLTSTNNPIYLSSSNKEILTFVESWDHLFKSPILFDTKKIFIWNKDLINDIKLYSKNLEIFQIYPLKFRYIEECSKHSLDFLKDEIKHHHLLKKDLKWLENKKFITYVCTAKKINNRIFPEELKIIQDLSDFCMKRGIFLYIKPKPDGLIEDFKSLRTNEYIFIGTGKIADEINMLNDSYHKFRYFLLRQTSLVINIGTTFVLEAALVNSPILQLSPSKDYPNRQFRESCRSAHLEHFLHSIEGNFVYDGNFSTIEQIIENFIDADKDNKNNTHLEFSSNLKKWVYSNKGYQDSLELIKNIVI